MDLSNLEIIHYIIITAAAILITGLLIVLITVKKKPKSTVDVQSLYETLEEGTIESINFTRSKINATVKRPRDVNLDALKEAGAVGVNVVGKKIKFYFEEENEAVYQALLETMKEKSQ
ncbi:MAG: hypothetical protein ACOC14_05975 [Bacillota bacterium]